MEERSVINAYQKILIDFRFPEPKSFSEGFAQKRFLKKMELPDSSLAKKRASACWESWIGFDGSLPLNLVLPPSGWYKARALIHKCLESFRLGEVAFSNGSEFTPTRGYQSIQQKLSRSKWDCTPGNLDRFADTCYSHPALKKAVRERYKNLLQKVNCDPATANRIMWAKALDLPPSRRARFIWRAKVRMVVNVVQGSRFSTVRKNNEKDRPINVEGFCNVVTQRQVGLGLKELILSFFGVDLEHGKLAHGLRISSPDEATLDLSNASDSVTLALVRFLFPRWFVHLLEDVRSPMVYGPDKVYHYTRKVSAMGNGFTFELMTLIILALTRSYDRSSSVYGDDIIVKNQFASQVIRDLEAVGFVVNKEKSFVDSPFRESCGANFHDDCGYIDSFDFEYPVTIGDCVSVHNKALILAQRYESFGTLYRMLTRVITDNAWLGQWVVPVRNDWSVPDWNIPPYFARPTVKGPGADVKGNVRSRGRSIFADLQLEEEPRFFYSWVVKEELASKTLRHLSSRQWAKYYMYLHSGGRTNDVLVGRGRWEPRLCISSSSFSTRWKSLDKAYSAEMVRFSVT